MERTKMRQKKQILIVDEAWQLMKYEDSADCLSSPGKADCLADYHPAGRRKFRLGKPVGPGRCRFNAGSQFLLKQS